MEKALPFSIAYISYLRLKSVMSKWNYKVMYFNSQIWYKIKTTARGVARNLFRRGDKTGERDRSPLVWGPGQSPGVGLGAKPQEAEDMHIR